MGTMESAQTLAPPLCAYIAKPIAATARPIIHQYSAWMAHGHWQCKSASQLGFQPCLHLGAICLCLRALRTCGGRATPSVNKPREWGCCGGPSPPFGGVLTVGFWWWNWALLHTLPVGSTTLLYHTLATLGCFCAPNPSPLPRSVL